MPQKGMQISRRFWIHAFQGLLWLGVIRGSGMLAGMRPGVTFNTRLDEALPLVPEAVWFYLLLYAFPPVMIGLWIFNDKARAGIGRFFLALWIATGVSVICYIAWPLRFDYASCPDTFSGRTLAALLSFDFDPPANKFPAFHATLPVLCCLAMRGAVPRSWLVCAWIAAAGVAVSAFLVEQHLVMDVVAGAALGFLAWALSSVIERRSFRPSFRS